MTVVRRHTPRLLAAIAYLQERVATGRENRETRLPAIRHLATDCGVSPVTMWKAVQVLKRDGALRVTPSGPGALHLSPSPPEVLAPKEDPVSPASHATYSLPRWQSVKMSLSGDLLAGVYPPGSRLPSYKELSHRYGTHFAAARQALAGLVGEGRITPYKRGFRVYAPTGLRQGSGLVLYTTAGTGYISSTTPFSAEFWRTLERECIRLDVNLSVRSIFDLVRSGGDAIRDKHRVLGYIVLTLGVEDLVADAVRILGPRRLPISLYAEADIPASFGSGPGASLVRCFAIARDGTAGRQMGSYLLSLGHRNVACFAITRHDHILETRAAGIDDALSSAVPGLRTRRCYLHEDESATALLARIATTRPYSSMAMALHTRPGPVPAQKAASRRVRLTNSDEDMLVYRKFLVEMSGPAFDRALADSSITAWVGMTDQVALAAHAHLQKRGKQLARDISLAGFDDTLAGFEVGLTSYDFNVPAAVHAVLGHIFASRQGKRRKEPLFTEIPGTIMTRSSSGARL